MVREFMLVNEKGEKYSLMNIKEYCFLESPNGLGYAYSTNYQQVGNVFVEDVRKIQQGQIIGNLVFLNYENYSKFINYIENSTKVRFLYKVPYEKGTINYYKDIQLEQLTKSEKKKNGMIIESVVFNCLSLWYEENITRYNTQVKENEIKWDFKWNSIFSNRNIKKITYINKGHIEAPIEIKMKGPLVNPTIKLIVEGVVYQELQLKIQIRDDETLLYGSKENEFYINKEKNNILESIINLETLPNFMNIDEIIRIPTNKSCEIKLISENDITEAEIGIFPQYKAV